MTFEEIAKDPIGKIYVDREEDGIRFIIMRGPIALCAYAGIHRLNSSIKIQEVERILDQGEKISLGDLLEGSCHGGVTYEGIDEITGLPKDYYFIGWDYAHMGDKFFNEFNFGYKQSSTGWTPEMVEKDSKEIVEAMKKYFKVEKMIRSITFE